MYFIGKQYNVYMKRGSMRSPIPPEVSRQLESERRMKRCVIGQDCSGVIQWHHSQTWKGVRLNEPWAIVGICENHHREESKWRDEIDRDCLNRATDEELTRISSCGSSFSA